MSKEDEILTAIYGEADTTDTLEPEQTAEAPTDEVENVEKEQPSEPEAEAAGDDEGEAVETAEPKQDDDETPVTYGRLKALEEQREKRRAAEERAAAAERELEAMKRQIAEQKLQTEAQPAPEWFDSPDDAFNHRLTPIQQQMQEMRTELWRVQASAEHGAEALGAAGKALSEALATGTISEVEAAAMQAPGKNPFAEMVRWHQSKTQNAEIGDVEAFKAKIIAEYEASRKKDVPAVPKSLQKGVSGSVATKGGVGSDDPLIRAVYG